MKIVILASVLLASSALVAPTVRQQRQHPFVPRADIGPFRAQVIQGQILKQPAQKQTLSWVSSYSPPLIGESNLPHITKPGDPDFLPNTWVLWWSVSGGQPLLVQSFTRPRLDYIISGSYNNPVQAQNAYYAAYKQSLGR